MTKKLWGGRFKKKTNPLVEEFTKSIQYDYKLAKYDVFGSIAHVEILKKADLLTADEAQKLHEALRSIHESIENKTFNMDDKAEDIHTNIQNILQEKVGDLALKIHMARSRNDQIVFATKLYLKFELLELVKIILELANTILELAKTHKHIIIPGFTHLQHAQPVWLPDYLKTYSDMLNRDVVRFKNIFDNIKITMGAGALAGTPIDADNYNLKASEFLKGLLSSVEQHNILNIQITDNPLDIVSDRDFVIEVLSALSILGMHLSRLSEDLIIWSTKEFDFVEIDESFCTGSSLMPQKKNPDVLELIRGYTGRLYGNLVSVLTVMKGLPLTYNRDMQLDKEPLFDSIEIISKELNVLTGLVKTLKFNEGKIEEHLKDESLYATDLVYYLVKKGESFKNAHTIIGELIKYSIDNKIEIKAMPEDLLREKFSNKFVKSEIIKLFDPKHSVFSKKSIKRDEKLKIFEPKEK